MPIYEYSCRKCNAHIEVMQKVSDKPLARHAGCGGRLEKEWSRTGFQFKGTGWYVTDYAGRKTDAKESQTEAKETKESAPKSETNETAAAADATSASKEKKGKAAKSPKPTTAPTGGD
ncbi:MAG TPA: FmdB family zinc ribbon protein [Pyrinomonadaceae bacterium]|nr:FmdB family zinc ribbon protein [Pyrinomonadaceae bacterium]